MTFRHALRASAPGQQESREALRGRARRAPAGSLALFLAIVGLCLAGRAWAVVLAQSTFDDPNNPYEGWIAHEWGGNDNPMQYHHTGGNPGGYIQATDINDGLDWYWMAPSEFLGNQSDAYGGTLGFDLRQRFNPGESPSQAVDNDVVLVGNGVTLVYQLGQTNWPAIGPAYPDSTGTWSVYSVPLVETDPNWHLGSYYGPAPTHDQFRSALADLGTLAVRGEYQNGADYGDLDSVALTGIGPAGFALASPANGDSVITTEPSLFWRASVATAQNDTIRYTVFWSEDPGFSPADSAAAGTDTTYAFGPSVLTIGNTYFWKVRAVDVNGFFAWSTPPEGWSFLISQGNTPSGLTIEAQSTDTGILLSWSVPTDLTALGYKVYRRTGDAEWTCISPLLSPRAGKVSFVDASAAPGVPYQYEVEVLGPSGPSGRWGPTSAEWSAPARLALSVGPNPGTGAVDLTLVLPHASGVSLRFLDATGREVAQRDIPGLSAGTHQMAWIPERDGRLLASGTYWVRLETPTGTVTRRWVLLR